MEKGAPVFLFNGKVKDSKNNFPLDKPFFLVILIGYGGRNSRVRIL